MSLTTHSLLSLSTFKGTGTSPSKSVVKQWKNEALETWRLGFTRFWGTFDENLCAALTPTRHHSGSAESTPRLYKLHFFLPVSRQAGIAQSI
jgi:hypothetical protein